MPPTDKLYVMCTLREWSAAMTRLTKLKQRLLELGYTIETGFTCFHLVCVNWDSVAFVRFLLDLDHPTCLASIPFYPRNFSALPLFPLHLAAAFNDSHDVHRLLFAAHPDALQRDPNFLDHHAD